VIRKATQADLPALVELAIEALNVRPEPALVIDRQKVELAVAYCVTNPQNFAWVDEDAGQVVGMVGAQSVDLMFHERKQLQVIACYCRRSGNGNGFRMLRQMVSWAKTKPLIKQICFSFDEHFSSRYGELLKKLGFLEVLPTYMLTR
jgi:N-acetylglutamate synthase-like GNAT family acetyltransferase